MTFLALDIGSSSVRAILFDQDANVIEGSTVSRKYSFDVTMDGGSTVDAEFLRGLVEQCMDEVLNHPLAASIRAVGMATFVGNVIGIDRAGNAITPIYTYADTRSSEDVDLLSKQENIGHIHQRTGCRLHTAYHPARFHWLKRGQPELFEQVDCWVDFGSYLYNAWFESLTCSYSVASWSGLLNRHTLEWDQEWLYVLGVSEEQFPKLADYTEAQRGLTEKYATRWPILRGVPFYLAVGDGAAANIGTGASTEDVLAMTVGTTAALRIVYPAAGQAPIVPEALWAYRVDRDLHLIGGATSEGGNVFQWMRKQFPSLDWAHEEQQIMQRPADVHGLTCLPLFNGERSPGWNSGASGTIHGLRLSTTPTDIVQAALEGIALRLAFISQQLPTVPETILIGGGAALASPLWVQMICNAINQRVHLVNEPEPTAHGVALLLAKVVDGRPLNAYKPVYAETFMPESDNVVRLKAAAARQADLYRRLYG
jgi:gluconokinase